MNKMNTQLVDGSAYRGALLLSAHAFLSHKPLEGRRRGIADPPRKFFLRQVCHLRLPFSLSLSIYLFLAWPRPSVHRSRCASNHLLPPWRLQRANVFGGRQQRESSFWIDCLSIW